MTTSGTYSYTVTRDTIIRLAMINIEKLAESENPTPQDITDCGNWLNLLVKQWQGKADFAPGLKTWTRRHGHLFLNGTTGQYSVGPSSMGWTNSYVQTTLTAGLSAGASVLPVTSVTGMTTGDNIGVVVTGSAGSYVYWSTVTLISSLNVTIAGAIPAGTSAALNGFVYDYTTAAQQPIVLETAFLRDQYNADTPLKMLTVQEYDNLPNKADPTNIADPVSVYYEFQLGTSNLFTDCGAAQDLTKHICATYMEEIQDFNNPLDNPEYPAEWYLPLALGLSKLICPMYHGNWTQLLEENANTALRMAQNKDLERIAAYFQPGED